MERDIPDFANLKPGEFEKVLKDWMSRQEQEASAASERSYASLRRPEITGLVSFFRVLLGRR